MLISELATRWDLGITNHFITVFRVCPLRAGGLPPFAFVMHSSGGELRAELPAFLLETRPSLTEDSIENLDFAGRAKRLGIYHRLTKANILPHGGGYALPQVKDVHSVLELEHGRLFEIGLADGSRQFIRETRGLPYSYRGEEVVRRSVQLGLGELAARLDPVFGLKP